jgi:ribonuclease BN (tRNA processing enzyme)
LPLGIGDAFSSLDYYTSMAIFGGQTVCLVDCPDPIRKILRERTSETERPLDLKHIDHVLLTHLHGDHCNGLETLLFYRRFVAEAPPPTIHMLREVADALWKGRLAMSMQRTHIPDLSVDDVFEPEDFYRVSIIEPDQPHDIGDLRFEVRRTIHSVPTFGFRVRLKKDADKARARVFGYSCDTVFDPNHVEFLSKANLIFHECGGGFLHTPYSDLVSLPRDVRERIHLLHLPDHFDREASELPIVVPGQIYTV